MSDSNNFSWFDSFGTILDHVTIKDLHLLETKGIIPSNSGMELTPTRFSPNEYEEVTNCKELNVRSTDLVFWVGVISSVRPSYPVPRIKTNCFTAMKVFRLNDELIFSCDCPDRRTRFYKIPKKEEVFIQHIGDNNVD